MPFALVTSVSASSLNQNDVTTAGVDTTGATLLVMAVALSGAPSFTPSDSKANTWTSLGTFQSSLGAGGGIALFAARSPTVGLAHTFTAAPPAGFFPAIAVGAYSGVVSKAVQSDLVVSNVATESRTTTDLSIGPLTTKDTGELLVVAAEYDAANSAWAVSAPFTLRQNLALTANAQGISFGDSIETTPVTRTARLTWTTKSTAVGAMAEFRVVPGTTSDDYSARGDQNTSTAQFLKAWFAEDNPDISSHRNRFSRLSTATTPAGGVSDIGNEMTLLVRASRGLTS